MINYTVEQELAVLSESGGNKKALTVTAWNNRPGKLDLRTWRTVDGEQQPGRGVTLSEEEAETLLDALTAYFRGADNEHD